MRISFWILAIISLDDHPRAKVKYSPPKAEASGIMITSTCRQKLLWGLLLLPRSPALQAVWLFGHDRRHPSAGTKPRVSLRKLPGSMVPFSARSSASAKLA